MAGLYLGVVCSECLTAHDLYNLDPAADPRGRSYSYICPASGRRVVVRVRFPGPTTRTGPTWAARRGARRPRATRTGPAAIG